METNAQYFDYLCRTCMNKVEASFQDGTTKPQQEWLSIFDTIEECGALRITELLSDAVPQIVVQPSDELPKKICTECLQRLLSVYWFRKMCVQSDKQMHELLSKEHIVMNTTMLEEAIKGETETDDADSQHLKDLTCNNTLQNLQQPAIQESLAEVTVQTNEPEAAQSSADDHLQENKQLLDYCNDSQGEFEEFIKNEPIEDDEANSEYSDGDTMHSAISVTKGELVELEDQQVNDASSRHNCHLCNKSYKRREYLRRHLNNHKKKANNWKEYCYACNLCSESYKKQQYLSRHLSLEHHNRSSHTQKSSILAEQRTTHAEDRPYECPYCPLRFSSTPEVSMHKTIHEGIKPHKCSVCGKKFRVKSNLTRHKQIHSKEKPHKCDVCEKRFTLMEQLKIHIRTHTGEKPFKCKYCQREFATPNALFKHLRRHLGNNIHTCKFCPLAFPSSTEMRLHFTSHKNEDSEVRERNIKALLEQEAKLKLKFSEEISKEQPTEEQQQHESSTREIEQSSTELDEFEEFIKNEPIEDEKPNRDYSDGNTMHSTISVTKDVALPIEFEDQQVNETSILAEQRTTHAYLQRYECPYCPLRFNSKSGVWLHKKSIHEGMKPHKCSVCGKKFGVKSNLTRHKRIHSKEKLHKCDQCEMRFTLMHQLRIHILKHTGEKPYKCKYCQSGFATAYALSNHLREHLGYNIHTCKFCPLAFPSSTEMRLHFTSHKNEDSKVRERNLKALHEQEAKLMLKFSKKISEGQSTEEPQQQKWSKKEIEQSSIDSLAQQRNNTHSGDKPHKCSHCPLGFSSKSLLTRHSIIHEEVKGHECDICLKRFGLKCDLATHKLYHSKEKPHKCEFCGKQFVCMHQLKIHIRTHTGENPYKCKYCKRGFISNSLMYRHLRGHLGKQYYRCELCPLAFPSHSKRRLHLTTHENEDPKTRERNLKALQEEEAKLVLKISKKEKLRTARRRAAATKVV